MQTLIECVPNFSEGRDPAVVEAIVRALLAGPDVYLLDREMDADHNRSVITFVGTRESVGKAALRGIGEAAELIDLNHHQGAHPRLGATDVVPFVPLAGVTLEDCVHIAEWVAEETWRRFKIPTYLYEAAARKPERVNLENIRRGQFEGVREEIALEPGAPPGFRRGRAAPHGGRHGGGRAQIPDCLQHQSEHAGRGAGQGHRQEDSNLERRIPLREGDGSGIESPQPGAGVDEPDGF